MQNNLIGILSYTIHKNQLKMDLRPETVQPLEESLRENLLDVGLGNDCLELTSKAQATKEKISGTTLNREFSGQQWK